MPFGTSTIVVFFMVISAVVLVAMLVTGPNPRIEARVNNLTRVGGDERASAAGATRVSKLARATLPKVGHHLLPTDEKEHTRLKARLVHAGFYGRQAMPVFLGVKLLLMTVPPAVCGTLCALGVLPATQGLLAGSASGIFGMIGPSFWLDRRKTSRQIALRRGLPDALDVTVICLEGGLSFPAAVRQVAAELRDAHPALTAELEILQREIRLGRSAGEALKNAADRTDLEELRNLSSVITQSERFGASLVKSFRIQAETLRLRRQQRAEEMAQKAATKILFPTLLFIFPAVFVVILGPAVMQISRTLVAP